MKTQRWIFPLLVASLGLSGVAQANPGHGNGHGNGHHGGGPPGHQGHGGGHHHQAHHGDDHRGHGGRDFDHHGWHEGGHLSRHYYHDDRYWVRDWHARHLSPPPRGHRWLHIDGDYVLAAVATGVITAIVLGH
ncbi:RcnB family protein [Salinicola avicenniae]|uniref:RcnB family protein n=1 Tax=Salinicola avicenniae TaxID=2916836 RepID=UPI002072D0F7|nr:MULTISPECIES: RcnB family protein [unclassified Salinicola]